MKGCRRLLARASKPSPSTLSVGAACGTLTTEVAAVPTLSTSASSPRRYTPPAQSSSPVQHPYAVKTIRSRSAEDVAAANQRANTQKIFQKGFSLWAKKARSFLTLTLGDAKYLPVEEQEELRKSQNINVSKAMGVGMLGWSEMRNLPTVDRPDKKLKSDASSNSSSRR